MRLILLPLLIAVLISGIIENAGAQVVEPCEDALDRAENSYFAGRFDESVEILTECIDEGAFGGEDLDEAYAMLGRTYFAQGREADARDVLRELLSRNPGYQADPIRHAPQFIALIEEVGTDLAAEVEDEPEDEPEPAEVDEPVIDEPEPVVSERRGTPTWLLVGGGATVVGVLGYALIPRTGSGARPPLPEPPALP